MTVYEIDEFDMQDGLHVKLTIAGGCKEGGVIRVGPFGSRHDMIDEVANLIVTDIECFSEEFGQPQPKAKKTDD